MITTTNVLLGGGGEDNMSIKSFRGGTLQSGKSTRFQRKLEIMKVTKESALRSIDELLQ